MQIWEEKYRPRKLSDVVFSSETQQKYFKTLITKEGTIPNMLFCGPPGTGKTTMSGVIANELGIAQSDIKRINCSDEKIEAIRGKVQQFAMTFPDSSRFNIVQLEEFDYLSLPAQALLRDLIESTIGNCVFIATCNYINKVMPAIRSRMDEHIFNIPNRDAIVQRAAFILQNENITFNYNDLIKVVSANYPDIRRTIKALQRMSYSGALVVEQQDDVSDWRMSIFEDLEKGNFKAVRKKVCENLSAEEIPELITFLYRNVDKIKTFNTAAQEAAICIIADHQYKLTLVSDVEVQVASLLIQLGTLV